MLEVCMLFLETPTCCKKEMSLDITASFCALAACTEVFLLDTPKLSNA